MSLFSQLNDDIFLLFSRGNRHLFARLVVELFERFFSDTVTFPLKHEVIGHIYDTLRANPDLWADEEDDFTSAPDIRTGGRRIRRKRTEKEDHAQDILRLRAQSAYLRLRATGWLEEESYGLKVTVDMSPAAMLLAERLTAIEKGLASSFRGVVVTIRNALAATVVDPGKNAAGLNKAAEMAIRFSRELRAVLSSLRGIERDILNAGNLSQRLATFFQEFIGRLVLKDFESIYKTNHPYRFKREILDYVDQLSDEGHIRSIVIDGYIEAEIATTRAAAGLQLDIDLSILRTVFDNVDGTYERINAFRVRLEGRLRNTIKYAEGGDHRHSQRLISLLSRLDRVLTDSDDAGRSDWLALHEPDAMVIAGATLWAPDLLAEPRSPREPVEVGVLRRGQADPALAAYRALLRHYNDLFVADTRLVLRYLEGRILPDAVEEARYLPIETIEDFLAFEQLRRFRHTAPQEFLLHFDIKPCPDESWRDDEWLKCMNFLVKRKTDTITLLENTSP